MPTAIAIAAAKFTAPWEAPGGKPVLIAYQDIAGIWTIGFGTTGVDVHAGVVWTEDQCYAGLASDMAYAVSAVYSGVGDAPTSVNELVAMADLAYNVGVSAFKSSTVLREHVGGNYASAAAGFLLWDKAHVNGKLATVAGLLNRRNAERNLYLASDAS